MFVVNKKEQKGIIIDIAVPVDVGVGETVTKSRKMPGIEER